MTKTNAPNNRIYWKTYLVRIVLTALCIGMLCFIFGNSLKAGEQSAEQSSGVVDMVQKAVGIFAPNSWIATATGEAYDRLHGIVRTIAHFCEFALLGALFTWCYRSYTSEKAFFFVPVCLSILVPIVDEFLQTLTPGRAAEMKDVLVDTAGGAAGCVFALLTLWIGFAIYKSKRKKCIESSASDGQVGTAGNKE